MNDFAWALARNLLKKDDEIDFRIQSGIEANRKGFGRIELFFDGKPVNRADVELKQKEHEFHFGCNAFMLGQFKQPEQNVQYEAAFKDLFNLAVAPFYWSDLEPVDGKPRFKKVSPFIYRRPAPDLVLEFCRKNKITPKGHPLFWHHYQPEWLPGDPQRLFARIEKRFQEISSQYAKEIRIWDVVNEALEWNPFRFPLPDGYVEKCFMMAERYFPHCTLTYNEVPWESWRRFHGSYTPVFLLVQRLQSMSLQVNALGLQYHMFCGKTEESLLQADDFLNPRYLYACMDQYQKLGIPLNISEITITGIRELGDGDEFQARVAERLYNLWFSHPAVNGIIWWNLVDGTAAYAPEGSEEGENKHRGGLVKYDFTPKKSYTALKRLIKEKWVTQENIQYADGTENQFHGFYGDYDILIHTDAGEFKRELSLKKSSQNIFKFELKS